MSNHCNFSCDFYPLFHRLRGDFGCDFIGALWFQIAAIAVVRFGHLRPQPPLEGSPSLHPPTASGGPFPQATPSLVPPPLWLFCNALGGGGLDWCVVGGVVGALNRCHLSNWRFNPETVHFLSSKRFFFADHVCVQMLQNKAFWPRFTFSQEAKTWKEKLLFLQCQNGGKVEITIKTTIWAPIIENVVRKGRK